MFYFLKNNFQLSQWPASLRYCFVCFVLVLVFNFVYILFFPFNIEPKKASESYIYYIPSLEKQNTSPLIQDQAFLLDTFPVFLSSQWNTILNLDFLLDVTADSVLNNSFGPYITLSAIHLKLPHLGNHINSPEEILSLDYWSFLDTFCKPSKVLPTSHAINCMYFCIEDYTHHTRNSYYQPLDANQLKITHIPLFADSIGFMVLKGPLGSIGPSLMLNSSGNEVFDNFLFNSLDNVYDNLIPDSYYKISIESQLYENLLSE